MLGKNVKLFSPQKQKQKPKGCGEMIKYEIKQFCMNTSLHGYRFIVLPKRVLLERVVWIILVVLSLIFAVALVVLAWVSFQENPTFVVTDSTQYQIWNYPFPAVTVCDYNKMNKMRAYKLASNLSDSKDASEINEMAQNLRLLFQLIQPEAISIPHQNVSRLQFMLDNKKIKIVNILEYLAPTCQEILQRCKWKGEEKRCENMFEMIPTGEGFCCSFNYLAMKGRKQSSSIGKYKSPNKPRRVSACGYQTGLEILLRNEPSMYFLTKIPSIGHTVLIHNSYHYPGRQVQTIFTEKRLLNLIDIVPSLTYSTSSLKELSIEKRKCLFFDERKLLNFRAYNHHNCIFECRVNLTLTYCDCIPIVINYKNYPKARQCDLNDLHCILKYKSMIHGAVPGYNFESDEVKSEKMENTCDCIPDCEHVHYTAQSASGKLTNQFASNPNNLYAGLKIVNQSVFRVFFDDLVGTRDRRDVTFSWHTLLAYYGGLLGLFVGFSFVSAIEIIYFFTIRLIADYTEESSNFRREKNKIRQLNNQKINVQPPEYLDPKKLSYGFVRQRTNSNPLYT